MKIKILLRHFFALIFVLLFGCLAFSQTPEYTVPVKWTNYSLNSGRIAFLMPKLPIVIEESNSCRGEKTFVYGGYADGSAYVVRVTNKMDIPTDCPRMKGFDKLNFDTRVGFLKGSPSALTERAKVKSKPNEVLLDGADRIHKLIFDAKNNRWFELLVIGTNKTKKEVKNFLDSLKIDKKTKAIEIGNGAERVFGDELKEVPNKKKNVPKKEAINPDENKPPVLEPTYGVGNGGGTGSGNGNGDGNLTLKETPKTEIPAANSNSEGVKIVLKGRAKYTDAARQTQTQGKVVLRVTFLANGGIGSISVISGLSNGLTEQSIAAARLILFIPAQRNGVRYSVTKPVEYSFTIY